MSYGFSCLLIQNKAKKKPLEESFTIENGKRDVVFIINYLATQAFTKTQSSKKDRK